MEFQQFKRSLLCKVQLFLGSEYEVCEQSVTKNNGVTLTGIMAKRADQNTFPTVYIDEHYTPELTNDDMEYLAMRLSKSLMRAFLPEPVSLDAFLNYETAKDRLFFKLINAEKNKELLLDVPHRRVHNLAVVFYYAMEDCFFEKKASILIHKSHIEQWGIKIDTLWKDALVSAQLLNPYRVLSMRELIRELYGKDLMQEDLPIYVLTNEDKYNGASALLYPGVTERLCELFGTSYYILPSSVHEMILVPDDAYTDEKKLLSMVSEINELEVQAEEILADSVYFYDSAKKEIKWVC